MVEASPSFPMLSIDFPNQGPSLAAENTKEHPEKQRHAGTGLRGRLGVVPGQLFPMVGQENPF